MEITEQKCSIIKTHIHGNYNVYNVLSLRSVLRSPNKCVHFNQGIYIYEHVCLMMARTCSQISVMTSYVRNKDITHEL